MSGLYAISVCISLAAIGLDESQNAQSDGPADKVAIDEITKLGASVVVSRYPKRKNDGKELPFIVIKKDWKGRDDGLKYVEQISNVKSIILEGNAEISDERLQKLKETHPHIAVRRRRSGAFLGITAGGGKQQGVFVETVLKDSPADKAGVLHGDLITRIDDEPVNAFREFIDVIDTKKAGAEVRLLINRNDQPIEIKAKLGSVFAQAKQGR